MADPHMWRPDLVTGFADGRELDQHSRLISHSCTINSIRECSNVGGPCSSMNIVLERVFACQDTAVLILRYCDIETLKELRCVNSLLQCAVDRWGISKVVVDLNVIRSLESTTRVQGLAKRFPSVTLLVVRHASSFAEVKEGFLTWHSTCTKEHGCCHVRHLELDACDLWCREDCIRNGERPLEGVERLELTHCSCTSMEVVSSLSSLIQCSLQSIRIDTVYCSDGKAQIPVFPAGDKGISLKTLVFLDTIETRGMTQCPLFCSPSSLLFYQERLENLDLSRNALCMDNIRLLFHEGRFVRLQKMRLRECGLHESHAELLSCSSSLPVLHHLDISGNHLGTQASMYYIAASAQLTRQLKYFNISAQSSYQDDALYGWSMTRNTWESLVTLKMNHARVNIVGMHGLLQSRMPQIRHIYFRETYITSDALVMLGTSTLFSLRVETLDISGTMLGVEVRRAVPALSTVRTTRLRTLLLRGSGLTSARAKSADRRALKELCRFHGPTVDIQVH